MYLLVPDDQTVKFKSKKASESQSSLNKSNSVKTNYEYHMKYLSSSSSSNSGSSQNSPVSHHNNQIMSPRINSPDPPLHHLSTAHNHKYNKRKNLSDDESNQSKCEIPPPRKNTHFNCDKDENSQHHRVTTPIMREKSYLNEMDHASMTKANIEACKGDIDLNDIECFLETDDLWKKFHDLGTEMIITKSGR